MRPLIMLLLLVSSSMVAIGQSETQSSDQVSAPFSIAISPAHQIVKSGAALWIVVRLTNVSNQAISVSNAYVDSVDISYSQNVWIGSVQLAARSALPIHIQTHSILRMLEPGESMNNITELSPQYDISQPGRYTIQLWRLVSSNPKDGMVMSNKITVTVTE